MLRVVVPECGPDFKLFFSFVSSSSCEHCSARVLKQVCTRPTEVPKKKDTHIGHFVEELRRKRGVRGQFDAKKAKIGVCVALESQNGRNQAPNFVTVR